LEVVISRPPGTDIDEVYGAAVLRVMQHEAALRFATGPPNVNRDMQQGLDLQLEIDATEERFQIDVGRPVDHEAERTALTVIAKVDHRS